MRARSASCLLLGLAACGLTGDDDPRTGEGAARVHVLPGDVPTDGECTHIVATRLADFTSTEYRGALPGAVFFVGTGDHRVTAVAYAEPCDQPPAAMPWTADEQIASFQAGDNLLRLVFRAGASVDVDPEFEGHAQPIVDEPTRVRVGRNGEDAAGPDLALDGWEVKQLTVPPPGGGPAGETVRFSVAGHLPYTPRGLARLPDGTIVAQIGDPHAAMAAFDADGAPLGAWPVVHPPGIPPWSWTDGLAAAGADRLVRTGWSDLPLGCDGEGAGCVHAGLDVLERRSGPGGDHLEVVARIHLPDLPGLPLHAEYPVGVAAVGDHFAVAILPDGAPARLVVVDAGGNLVAGPTAVEGSPEGVLVLGDGRLATLTYDGRFATYDAADLAPRPGEELIFEVGAGYSYPIRLAWSEPDGAFLAVDQFDRRLVWAGTDFTAVSDAAPDLTGYGVPIGLAVRPEAGQLAVIDRFPPIDGASGLRIPRVDLHDLASGNVAGSVLLGGVPLPAQPFGLAYVPVRQQLVSHHRRPGAPADPVNARAFVHDLAGALAYTIDLRPYGFVRIASVAHLPATDELLFVAVDLAGTPRLVITDAAGTPRRSYRLDALAGFTHLAPITSGPLAGQLGAVFAEPSAFVRLALP
jgi:hypothetical protein